MKKRIQHMIVIGLASLSLLVACGRDAQPKSTAGQTQTTEESSSEEEESGKKNTLTEAYYPAAIKDGSYPLSNSRGTLSSRTSQANLENMERGLYELMKNAYPTDEYSLAEGQVLSKDKITSWLKPKSQDNPEGLNPEASAASDRDQFQHRYLNSILEYNLMQENGDDYDLKVISLGLAMNAEDRFQNKDTEETVEISRDQALQEGKAMAQTVVERIRQEGKYGQTPIQIALFYNDKQNSLGGGAYMAEAIAEPGAGLGKWKEYNRQYVVYGVDQAPREEDNTSFSRFRGEIESFFPELSGIVGVGQYDNGKLNGIDFHINTPFDGYTENIALVQHVIASLDAIYPKDVQMQVTVEGPSRMTANITRLSGQGKFQYTVY
ncbi:CamS family sex pheromone protein [Aerococcus tenax]|uniref:CamS family sex pheromone protein n=1 Tax=Aerococcus tenax TaxID=3078812 RepID=UPI000DCC8A76|nr:CamS family sex pheromone protein [Aerococcus tenax]WIW73400.1 CamS family sex pheromone protein [Aerococcus tenax]